MKSLTINPWPFYGAQTVADYANDPKALGDHIGTLQMTRFVNATRPRISISFQDCFEGGVDRTVRRIDSLLKYWPLSIMWVIDGLRTPASDANKPGAFELFGGVTGVATLLQKVIDKCASRKGITYSFGEVEATGDQACDARLPEYMDLASRVNFRGATIEAPPIAAWLGADWETPARVMLNNKAVAKLCSALSFDIYGKDIAEIMARRAKIENFLRQSGKRVTVHETGGCTNYTNLEGIELGRWIKILDQNFAATGMDYGLYCGNDGGEEPKRFSIFREDVFKGYISA